MRNPRAIGRGLPLRWKILVPFVAMSLATWIIAAEILGRSAENTVLRQGQAEADEIASIEARHLELRAAYFAQLVTAAAVEGQLMVGDRSMAEALRDVGPNLVSAFGPSAFGGESGDPDLVKLIDGSGETLIQMRRNLLETAPLDDAALVAATRSAHHVGGIVTLVGQSKAYVVGAASLDITTGKRPTLILGVSLNDGLLAETGSSQESEVFVVGPAGILAAIGPTSSDREWESVLADRVAREATVSGADFVVSSAPVETLGAPDLRVVVAVPTAKLMTAAWAGRVRAWAVLGVGLAAFVALALWLSASLTRPLHAVSRAVNALAAGDLEARAQVTSDDEIGRLALAFNTMGDELEGRADRLAKAFDEMRLLSETDALTGLLNHRAVHAVLDREVQRARRHGRLLSVAIIDIDNFKLINDTYGHPAGDLVIKQVTTVLETGTRASDILGRHGGDEFIVIMPETGSEDALVVAHKLRAAMHEHPMITPDGLSIPIRLSIGTGSFPGDCTEVNELLAFADANLYVSKRRGGDSVTQGVQEEQIRQPGGDGFSMLDSMVTAVDNKDRYTRRHSEDVTALALMTADLLGLDEATERTLRVAGLLHDVGKIGVPDALLRRPGHLTPDECEIVKNHTTLAGAIIQGIPNEEDIRRAVVAHHERWDGQGYPAGLKGTAIPRLARILSIADAYAAMISDRPYRQALTREEALAEIEKSAGSQFDPELVRAFLLGFSARGDEHEAENPRCGVDAAAVAMTARSSE